MTSDKSRAGGGGGGRGALGGGGGVVCVALAVLLVLLAAAAAVVVLVLYFTTSLLPPVSPPRAVLPAGSLVGRTVPVPGVSEGALVNEFLGIPYALPPVGERRFADPVPVEKFENDPQIAQAKGPSCPQNPDNSQGSFSGTQMWNPPGAVSEDCLYLNVWAPRAGSGTDPGGLRPVMVWIFGGGFITGTAALAVYDGRILAASQDVLVVSLEYRLGALGFLATGDGRLKGNFGSKDQALALRWVHDNIRHFGGDPAQVTIFGESAGAASVGYSMLSPMTNNLFHRAILQSGSPNSHWSFINASVAARRSRDFITDVGCSQHDEAAAPDLLACLRHVNVTTILANQWRYPQYLLFPWAPVIDGEYLLDSPYNLIKSGNFPKKDVLLGSNKDEATFWFLYWLPKNVTSVSGDDRITYSQFMESVDTILWDISDANKRRVVDLYEAQQFRDLSDERALLVALDHVSGDRSFGCPPWTLAQDLAAAPSSRVYYYYLTHRASNEVWPPWMGVIHGADIQWIFGMPLDPKLNYNEEDKRFAKQVMKYISNFAKTGDPNRGLRGGGGGDGVVWPRLEPGTLQYLEWRGPEDFRTNATWRDAFCTLWAELNSDWYEGRPVRR